jgi:D-lyxose ketol-isomerase
MNSPELKKSHQEIWMKNLGWDVTDFGGNDFASLGCVLFTIRNGKMGDNRDYAEKILILREKQVLPWHYHWAKTEDIICRAGGNLIIEVFKEADKMEPNQEWYPGKFDQNNDVVYAHDGILDQVPAGNKIVLTPGESITITPRMYHKFYVDPNSAIILIGEVSKVNDDTKDNRFYTEMARFAGIIEDELPIHLLCNEYERATEYISKI